MAIRPDYDIGTVTLTSGSSDFTTSGSSLQTAAVQAGDAIIAPSGHVLIIASITGQNSGTLFLPCPPDAAGTGLPLRIRFQPDGSRYQGAVRNLIDLLSSGNIEALAALVGAAGMVPIFTGPGTLDLADPATFGIRDPNGSLGKLAALTLAARQILQTDAAGDLKQVALAANKALATDANGDVTLVDLGTLGRDLLSLSTGTDKQFIRGDGTLGGEVFGTAINGGVIWPNGEMEQWGFVGSLDSGGGAVITYPRAFSEISIFIPVILTDWVSGTFAPLIYQDWAWGNNRLTSQTVWCRRADTGGPLLVGNIRWYARGKA